MSTVIPIETERRDPEGDPLVPARHYDAYRHQAVWAVYRFQPECRNADARCSEFIGIAEAKGAADDFNRTRVAGQAYYYRVYRPVLKLIQSDKPNTPSASFPPGECGGHRYGYHQPLRENS